MHLDSWMQTDASASSGNVKFKYRQLKQSKAMQKEAYTYMFLGVHNKWTFHWYSTRVNRKNYKPELFPRDRFEHWSRSS